MLALIALVAAALVWPASWLRAAIAGSELSVPIVWPLVVFATAFLIGLAFLAARAPSWLSLARDADRRLGQLQRLSTAFEVQTDGSPGSRVIVDALVAEVEQRVGVLDPRSVGSRPVPRGLWLLLLVSLSLASVASLLPVPVRSLVDGAVSVAGADPTVGRPDIDASLVQRVAELLAATPETEASPYLQAVASSFAELGERLSLGDIDAAEAERMLNELLEHLQDAAQTVGGTFAQTIEAAIAANGSETETPSTATPSEEPTSRLGQAPEVVETTTPRGEEQLAEPSSGPDLVRDGVELTPLDRLMAELERQAGEAQTASAVPTVGGDSAQPITGGIYGGVAEAATDPNALPPASGLRSDAIGAGDAVGAAQQSTERAGDAAGGGGAALEGGSDGSLEIDGLGMTEAVALPWSEREDGRRVETTLVPEETAAAGPPSDRGSAQGLGYARSQEAAVTAVGVGAAFRDVVSRYFLPGTAPGVGTP